MNHSTVGTIAKILEEAPLQITRGIEKESLRITGEGRLAQTPHPIGLGHSLHNPSLTTDYAENMLEFITEPTVSFNNTMDELTGQHILADRVMEQEWLWPASMPCTLDQDTIALAQYGDTNTGQLKHIYRRGLRRRYGDHMQIISGIHFNFSVNDTFIKAHRKHSPHPGASHRDFRNKFYMNLMHHLWVHAWIVPYLTGSSPAMTSCFRPHHRPPWTVPCTPETWAGPHATSLRLSEIGYHTPAQKSLLGFAYHTLEDYCFAMSQATRKVHPEYAAFPPDPNGYPAQLSPCLLQIEDEYYAGIRPKSRSSKNMRMLRTLQQEGILYVELRLLDVDPFLPMGINELTVAFLETLMLFCAMQPPFSSEEQREHMHHSLQNLQDVVREGRRPGLRLRSPHGKPLPLQHMGQALMHQLAPIASLLQTQEPTRPYQQAWTLMSSRIEEPRLLPSQRVLDALSQSGSSFAVWGMQQAHHLKRVRSQKKIQESTLPRLMKTAQASIRQHKRSSKPRLRFATFLKKYMQLP